MTKIQKKRVSEIIPDSNNANAHTERGSYMLDKSIDKFGFRFAGTLDKDDRIVHGNHRHEKAGAAGIEDVVVIEAEPDKQYYLKYNDLDLTDPENPARELAYVANRSAQVSIDFDAETMAQDIAAGLELDGWWYDWELEQIGTLAEDNDLDAAWDGMPEFVQEDASSFKCIKVHFASEQDMMNFAQLVKQVVTMKTTHIWYPEQERIDLKKFVVKDES